MRSFYRNRVRHGKAKAQWGLGSLCLDKIGYATYKKMQELTPENTTEELLTYFRKAIKYYKNILKYHEEFQEPIQD